MSLVRKLIWKNKVPVFWFLAAAITIAAISWPMTQSGMNGLLAMAFLFVGYFFLAAGTVYHSLAKRGLTCDETYDREISECYCFCSLLLAFIFFADFGYALFAGFSGALNLALVMTIVMLYALITAARASIRIYKCRHPPAEN